MIRFLKLPTLGAIVAVMGAIAAAGLFSSTALAASGAAQTIATIVKDLNHFPSEEQKQTLTEISEDENNSEALRTIAEAVRDMQHSVQAEDKADLEAIASNQEATEAEQQLASVVMNITHKPDSDAVAKLEQIASK